MKKLFATTAVLALVVGALSAPSLAAKKKAKPVTLFFHGSEPVGEADMLNSVSSASGAVMPMDTTEPTGAESKSFQILDLVATPNEACSGNPLFPSWQGRVSGVVTGDVKVVFNTIASAGTVDVELFVDAGPLSCNETYIEPVGEVTVDLPAGTGTVEAVIENVNFKALAMLTVMINPKNLDAPAVGRVLYDSTTDNSRIEFSCIPAGRAKACTQ